MPEVLKTKCPACSTGRALHLREGEAVASCQSCKRTWEVNLFPAAFAVKAEDHKAEKIVDESISPCFAHPDNAAVTACVECGIYLCRLCQIDRKGESFCPNCFSKKTTGNSRSGKAKESSQQRLTHWDSIALGVAFCSIFFWFISFILAPITFWIIISKWKAPLAPHHKNRWRFVVGGLLSLLIFSITLFAFIASMND